MKSSLYLLFLTFLKALTSVVFCTTLSAQDQKITALPTSITAFLGTLPSGPINTPKKVSSFSEYSELFGQVSQDYELSLAVWQFFNQHNKQNALIVRLPDADPIDPEEVVSQLKKIEIFEAQIYCIPQISKLSEPLRSKLVAHVITLAHDKGAMAFIDPPAEITDVDDLIDWKKSLDLPPKVMSHGAMYFPMIDIHRSEQPSSLEVSPSGSVAGIFSRTDQKVGIWRSPSGIQQSLILNGIRIKKRLNHGEEERLYSNGINPIKQVMNGNGIYIWGVRTMGGPSSAEWMHIPTTRFYSHIEKSIQESLRWTQNDPNSSVLWKKVNTQIIEFLDSYYTKGALVGQSSHEAYFSRCDSSTTSSSDIEAGKFTAVYGVSLLRPSEFYIGKILLKAQGLTIPPRNTSF